MWFSFSTNVLIFITAMILSLSVRKEVNQKYFLSYIILTGVAALIAAFGHLEIVEISLQNKLMFVSRFLNIISVFTFVAGTMKYFEYESSKWIMPSTYAVTIFFIVWLILHNVFFPVMIFAIMGMAIVSLGLFIKNFSINKTANKRVIYGMVLLILSALVFTMFNSELIKSTDVSHILIALSLVTMARGFKQMDLYEVKT